MMLSFNSKDPYVQADRWIASLSDGSTVFEDKIPGRKSAWFRLADYLKDKNLSITNLRLEAYNQRITLVSSKNGADGYWQASKIATLLNGPPTEFCWRGIGYIQNNQVHITWIGQDGSITHEVRSSENDVGVIFNSTV
jgi:hypothetical protein